MDDEFKLTDFYFAEDGDYDFLNFNKYHNIRQEIGIVDDFAYFGSLDIRKNTRIEFDWQKLIDKGVINYEDLTIVQFEFGEVKSTKIVLINGSIYISPFPNQAILNLPHNLKINGLEHREPNIIIRNLNLYGKHNCVYISKYNNLSNCLSIRISGDGSTAKQHNVTIKNIRNIKKLYYLNNTEKSNLLLYELPQLKHLTLTYFINKFTVSPQIKKSITFLSVDEGSYKCFFPNVRNLILGCYANPTPTNSLMMPIEYNLYRSKLKLITKFNNPNDEKLYKFHNYKFRVERGLKLLNRQILRHKLMLNWDRFLAAQDKHGISRLAYISNR